MAKGGQSLPFQKLQQSAAAKSASVASMHKTPSSFTVDFNAIDDPRRIYYAQECWTELDRGIVGIFFAQKSRSEGPLRSLVCMRMAPAYIVHWLKSVSEIHSPSIAELASNCGVTPEQLNPIPGEAEQTFESSANVVRTGMSSLDVTLDFIKFSPFEIGHAKGGKPAKGDPQVRIETRASLFLGLLENLREMSNTFPPDVRIGQEE
ncbi:MAG: hypothetical protein M0P95_00940 [Sulfuritalea sp.]|jgi:hypothetical protein|nr:hypothetical protein [Sulfuritalea sp.]